MSVNEALEKLLDLGENDVKRERELRGTFRPFVTSREEDVVMAAKQMKAAQHLENLKLGGD